MREKQEDGGKGVGMIEREKEKIRRNAHERAIRNDGIARVTMTCGGQSDGKLQTEKTNVGEVRERPRRRTGAKERARTGERATRQAIQGESTSENCRAARNSHHSGPRQRKTH